MRKLLVVLAFVLPATAGAQVAMEMTPEVIQQAIDAGMSERKEPVSVMLIARPMPGSPGPVICGAFLTPFARVAAAARAAKGEYRAFTAADVTPEMVEPSVLIMARSKLNNRMDGVRKVKLVVVAPISSDDLADVVRATHVEFRQESFGNAMGAKAVGAGAMAKFPLSVLSPDNEVRIVYDGQPECRASFNLAGVR
jgi:hypothetical protein